MAALGVHASAKTARRLGAAAVVVCGLVAVHSSGPAAAAPALHRRPAPAGGTAESWGDNSAGELGNGTLTPRTTPGAVSTLSGVLAVASGGRHDLALLSNGAVMAWGDNTFGQLGNGVASTNDDTETPITVAGISGAIAVAAGAEFSMALLSNGTVMAWGDNSDGQLGDGTKKPDPTPVEVEGLSHVTAISAGGAFGLALLSNGTVMAWGDNSDGQLGDGSLTNSDVPVAVHCLGRLRRCRRGTACARAVGQRQRSVLGRQRGRPAGRRQGCDSHDGGCEKRSPGCGSEGGGNPQAILWHPTGRARDAGSASGSAGAGPDPTCVTGLVPCS